MNSCTSSRAHNFGQVHSTMQTILSNEYFTNLFQYNNHSCWKISIHIGSEGHLAHLSNRFNIRHHLFIRIQNNCFCGIHYLQKQSLALSRVSYLIGKLLQILFRKCVVELEKYIWGQLCIENSKNNIPLSLFDMGFDILYMVYIHIFFTIHGILI